MDIVHNGVTVAELDDFSVWRPAWQEPEEGAFVLLTLEEEGDRWVEPGQWVDKRFVDIHRGPFREKIVAWVKFPEAYAA